uniref:DC1 domain-containing protein n=1 Tax=Brassica oleracea var. oleracea TaxID=109376 RepID=A0A0D2ZWT4_BRAOL
MRDEVRSIPSQTSPPVDVECLNTHEHQLHLVPRLIDFTCNACGTQGNRNPYFCLPCNFMIHRECIDLPRVININRHDHLISYTPRLGHGEWKCRVFRKKVEGFYGAYSCSKCATFAVHARCATRTGVWDMVEREGTPEEEEIVP